MSGNGKVFINHTHEDNAHCAALLAALDAWGVGYWFDLEQLGAGQQLTDRIRAAIVERDIFVRVCTLAADSSFWMTLEATSFRGLRAGNRQRSRRRRRTFIALILDADYPRASLDLGDLVVDASNGERPAQLRALRAALGLTQPARQLTRRAALSLWVTAAAGIVAVSAAGSLLVTSRLHPASAAARSATPPVNDATPPANPLGDARIRWQQTFSADSGNQPLFALAGEMLFVAATDALYALSATDGSLIWRSALAFLCPFGGAGPRYADGVVYVGNGSGAIFALDARDGAVLWSAPTSLGSGVLNTPTVAHSTLFVCANNTLYALSAFATTSGQLRWHISIAQDISVLPQIVRVGNTLYASDASTVLAITAPASAP